MPTIAGLPASLPEISIARELDKMGLAYEFQNSFMGGRMVAGGFVADFYLASYSLIISVLGEYWHYGLGQTASDVLQALGMNSQGITVIFIDESDALKNPHWYISEALKGIDHSKLANK